MKVGTVLLTATLAMPFPAMSQTDVTNNKSLTDCVKAADDKYKATWSTLCSQAGKVGYCTDFVGSPKDLQFSQLRNDEKSLCARLYR